MLSAFFVIVKNKPYFCINIMKWNKDNEGFIDVKRYINKLSGPLEKVCGYRSTIKILFCPFIKLNNG